MKKYFSKALLLTFGLGVAVSLTSCHSGSDETAPEITQNITPKHAIRGTILDGNGAVLTGATVSLSRQGTASTRLVSVVGNTFEVSGLDNGTWTVIVTKNGYKSQTESVTLAVTTQTIEGKSVRVGQNVDQVFYLAEEVKTKAIKLGGETSTSDEITIETTTQDDGTGTVVNTTDPTGDQTTAETITVVAETPAISGDAYTDIETQLQQQGGSIEDFSMYLVNITSLEDAKELAEEAGSAARAFTRATTALPDGREMLAGVGLNTGGFELNLPDPMTVDVTITLPDDNTKGAVKLYRTITGDSWEALSASADDVAAIDMTKEGIIIVRLKVLRTQSFALGVQIEESEATTEEENIVSTPLVNNSSAAITVTQMKYTVKDGVVLQNTVQGALTDFLRKVMLRKYGTRAVSTAANVEKTYTFSPAFSLPAYGTLTLEGVQTVTSKNYRVVDAQAAFNAREYGPAKVSATATYPEPQDDHVGGGS